MDKSVLKVIADNPNLMAVLRELLDEQFGFDGLLNPSNPDDSVLGQIVRSRLTAREGIAKAFEEIERHRTTTNKLGKINPAR